MGREECHSVAVDQHTSPVGPSFMPSFFFKIDGTDSGVSRRVQSVVFASCSCNRLFCRISTLTGGDHDGATPGLHYPLNRRSTRRDASQVFLLKSIRPVEGQDITSKTPLSFLLHPIVLQTTNATRPRNKIFEPVRETLPVVLPPIQFHTTKEECTSHFRNSIDQRLRGRKCTEGLEWKLGLVSPLTMTKAPPIIHRSK